VTDYEAIQSAEAAKLHKALQHLSYSYDKILNKTANIAELDEEGLADWESFSARFSRVADIFLAKYVRTCVLIEDPGYKGTMRDFVNQGEKLGIIDDARAWIAIRELRNITVHDYPDEDLAKFLERLRTECPRLLAIAAKI